MGLGDFFRINLPYGLNRNLKDEWFAFNREYVPLGWNSTSKSKSIFEENVYSEMPIYTKYKGLTEAKILKIIKDPTAIHREPDGRITRIFFYSDRTNPKNDPQYWRDYLDLIKQFSDFEVKTPIF